MGTENNYLEEVIKTEKEINKMISKIAKVLNSRFKEDEVVVFVVVMKGGMNFAVDLSRKVKFDVKFDFITSKSYYLDKKVTDPLINFSPTISLKDKNVVVVDDFVDSGLTMIRITELLAIYNPKSISVAGIFGNPKRELTKFKEYYCWIEEPNGFLMGYGLDYDEKYRNLPYIGIIKGTRR